MMMILAAVIVTAHIVGHNATEISGVLTESTDFDPHQQLLIDTI